MKIALIGYGKMGKTIEQIAIGNDHQIVHRIDTEDSIDMLKKGDVDIAIEFTQPDSAFANLSYCIENNIPVISGTTGWLDQKNELEKLCRKHDGTFLYASNFSIGVNLFFELNSWLAAKMKKLAFSPSMTEIHHTEKKDSPSGTAITLAEGILKHSSSKTSWINEETTDHQLLGIKSERIPNVPGTHNVSYSSALESIEIQHTAHDRSVFAEGVLMVAEWIHTRKGIFTMSDFINNN